MSIGRKSYLDMREQVGRMIGDTSTARKITITNEWLNHYYEEAVARHRWRGLLADSELQVATVASEKFVYLPKDVDELYFFRVDSSGNRMTAQQAIQSFFSKLGDNQDTVGAVENYADAGQLGRSREYHTAAERLTLLPTVNMGASTVDVVIQGLIGESLITETVSVTGAGVNSTNTYNDLISVSAADFTLNLITVLGATSGNTYAVISPHEKSPTYRRIRLGSVPDTARNVTFYYKRTVMPLEKDEQVIEIPVAQFMIHKTIAMHKSKEGKWTSAASWHEAKGEQAMMDAINREETHSEVTHQSTPLGASHRKRWTSDIRVSNG